MAEQKRGRAARPQVQIDRLSYVFTVQVSGRPPRHFRGTSQEELERDLAAAAAEIGAGEEPPRG